MEVFEPNEGFSLPPPRNTRHLPRQREATNNQNKPSNYHEFLIYSFLFGFNYFTRYGVDIVVVFIAF